MDTSERLAAYAAGELAPDEATALEAALAGDAQLRAQLARIRHADELLAELPAVDPPAAFSARLRETLVAELAEAAPVVDLAAARQRRAQRWMAPAAGVAAAAAAVFGIAQIGSLGGSDDATSDEAAITAMADDAGDAEFAPENLEAADGQAAPGPIYTEGGSYDRDTLALLASNQQILSARDFASGDPSGFQFPFLDQLTANSSAQRTTGGTSAAEPQADGAEADTTLDAPAVSAEALSPVSAVAACIPVILEQERVPLFADLGTFEGAQALVVVLGAPAPDGSFSRLEFWVLDPVSCEVLHFAQR